MTALTDSKRAIRLPFATGGARCVLKPASPRATRAPWHVRGWLSASEYAEILHRSLRTVQHWLITGQLPSTRTDPEGDRGDYRIPASAVPRSLWPATP